MGSSSCPTPAPFETPPRRRSDAGEKSEISAPTPVLITKAAYHLPLLRPSLRENDHFGEHQQQQVLGQPSDLAAQVGEDKSYQAEVGDPHYGATAPLAAEPCCCEKSVINVEVDETVGISDVRCFTCGKPMPIQPPR